MKRIKNEEVRKYVMDDMSWKADLPQFFKEVCECTNDTPYAVTFNIIKRIFGILAQRAIELNDPALNIIMLNLSLYDGSHDGEYYDKAVDAMRNEIVKCERKRLQ